MLFLAKDNSLQDVSDLIGDRANSDLVKDYKKLASKNPGNNPKPRRKCPQPERPRILLYSRDISDRTYDEENPADADWNVIASTKLSDHTYVSLVTLNGALCRISIQLRLNTTVAAAEDAPTGVTSPSPVPSNECITFDTEKVQEQVDQPELFCEVATMSESKCGLGVAEYDGKLIVVGGYGRTECLKSVESYCPISNKWQQELSLNEARGRVQIAVIDNIIYAVGGSNGITELDTVECLTMSDKNNEKAKWKKCAKLPFPRSNAGICSLNGKIYCIGGNSTGQNGIKQCDVYNPETNSWSSIAPLNNGRCQAGVIASNGKLWAAGGSDAWNCLNSVECYDPEEDTWIFVAPMLTARRGCGLAELKGKIICVGGSDGSQSLKSTEYYDDDTHAWILGPSLNTARSNVSVAVIQDRLYAIGGFSGKKFLNTIEYFDEEANEWTKFAKLQPITATNNGDPEENQTDPEHKNGDFVSNEFNGNVRKDFPRKVSFKKTNEKDKISEDESESAIIMPIS
jgi:influenza virus NS1A-binding protein